MVDYRGHRTGVSHMTAKIVNGEEGGADNAQLTEWAECRTTIGRLDTILKDLRQYGFTLIAGLLTASSFIGYGSGQPRAGVAAYVAVMCLIAALFSVDIYYSVLQSGAVERALNLEANERPALGKPRVLITATVSYRTTQVGSKFVILGVYVLLLFVAAALALVASGLSIVLIGITLAVGLPLIVATVGYWRFVATQTNLHHWRDRQWPPEPPFDQPNLMRSADPKIAFTEWLSSRRRGQVASQGSPPGKAPH